MTYRKELERLFALEYGDRTEFGIRVASILTAGTLLVLYTGEARTFAWLGGFSLCQIIYFCFLKRHMKTGGLREINIATGLLATVQLSYLWMPASLVLRDDPVLIAGGITGVVTMLFFMLRRSDSLLSVVLAEAGVAGVTTLAVMWLLLPQLETRFQQICVGFCLAMMAYYFAAALFKARQLRRAAEATAERDAHEEKLASIGRLAGGVAHDFNNALTGIAGNIELYFEIEDPSERAELLRIAQTSTARAAALVQQLLVFSRQTGLDRARHEACAVIEDVAAAQREVMPMSVAFEVVGEPGLPIEVDKSLLVSALSNLVANALDAMPDGGQLTLSALLEETSRPRDMADGRSLPPNRYARLAVSDTGQGIPAESLPRVLEPFYSTKRVGQGSGLGLSMVVGLAQSLSGGVEIATGSQGTTVSILVPLAGAASSGDAER